MFSDYRLDFLAFILVPYISLQILAILVQCGRIRSIRRYDWLLGANTSFIFWRLAAVGFRLSPSQANCLGLYLTA